MPSHQHAEHMMLAGIEMIQPTACSQSHDADLGRRHPLGVADVGYSPLLAYGVKLTRT